MDGLHVIDATNSKLATKVSRQGGTIVHERQKELRGPSVVMKPHSSLHRSWYVVSLTNHAIHAVL